MSRLTIATIAVFIALFKPDGFPISVKSIIQIGMLIVALLCFLSRKKNKCDNVILFIIIPICFSSIIAYFNKIITIHNLINCFFYMICLWVTCQILINWVREGKYFYLIVVLQRLLSVYCLLSLISVFLVGVSDSSTTTYLFGGKFITSYYFLLFLGLTYARYQEKVDRKGRYKLLFGLLSFLVFLFEMYLQCTTGYIIIAVFYLLVVLPKNIRPVMTRRITVLAAIIASGIVPIFINAILSITAVQNIIVNILGKSANLTSRLPIYTIYLFPLIEDRMWFGYGYASSIMHLRTGVYWNAQNGLFDILLNYGFLGVAGFLTACYKVSGEKIMQRYAWPFYAVLYSLVLASTIEISYDMIFFFVLSMIFAIRYWPIKKEECSVKTE